MFLSQSVQVELQLSEVAAVRTIPGNKSAQKLLQRYHGKDKLPSVCQMNVQLILSQGNPQFISWMNIFGVFFVAFNFRIFFCKLLL